MPLTLRYGKSNQHASPSPAATAATTSPRQRVLVSFPGSKCSKSWRTNYQGLVSYLFVNSGQSSPSGRSCSFLATRAASSCWWLKRGNRASGKLTEGEKAVATGECPVRQVGKIIYELGLGQAAKENHGTKWVRGQRLAASVFIMKLSRLNALIIFIPYLWARQKTLGRQCVNPMG